MEYVDTVNKDRFIPYVIETSGGVTRSLMAFLCNAYEEEEINENGKTDTRTVLRFHKDLAPIKVAVFPLVKKDGMPEFATEIFEEIQKEFKAQYDESGAIGRRYRRQDEIGTPYCITIDGQSLEDGTVTVRDRDTMEQVRINKNDLISYFKQNL